MNRDTTPRGSYLEPAGPFVLAAYMDAPGVIDLAQARDLVFADWRAQAAAGTVSSRTVRVDIAMLRGFLAFAAAQGARVIADITAENTWGWLQAPSQQTKELPTASQQALRRSIARNFFRTLYRLGITEANPAASLTLAARPKRLVAALSDEEVLRLKAAADYDALQGFNPDQHRAGASKTAAAIALALLGAQGGEIGAVRAEDVRLLEQAVWVHDGGERYTDRWVPIDDPWCFAVLASRLAFLAARHPEDWQSRAIAYEPRPERNVKQLELDRRRASIATTIAKAMAQAGIRSPGRIRVGSIGDYVAARVFAETGRVEDVAVRLGLLNLDNAAHIVGYDWRAAHAFNPLDVA